MRSSFIKYCICTFDERFSVCGLFLFADISTAVNKHHSSQAQQIVIVATIIQGDSYFCCLNSWSVIKAGSLKKSHVLCFLYILRIETCSMMWNTGLYSFGNWTCMITALLLSVVRTNLQSMKSDLIKIVWSKFVLWFNSVNLSRCVCGVWYDACAIDENMLILSLPYNAVKLQRLGSRAFSSEASNMFFSVARTMIERPCRSWKQ